MQYLIQIGELDVLTPKYSPNKAVKTIIAVKDEISDVIDMGVNCKCFTYCSLERFCNSVGLRDVFFIGGGSATHDPVLLYQPGAVMLSTWHLQRFCDARGNYEGEEYLDTLHWFIYWAKWALDNCKNPVISNS